MKLTQIITEIISEPKDLDELSGPYKEETEIIYKDKNIVCLVPKSQMSSKMFGKGTNWCSTSKNGFEMWAEKGLLIRFLFRGGKKIRVTYMFDGTYNWANENGWHTLEGKGNPFKPTPKNTGYSNEVDVLGYIQKIPEECKNMVLKFIKNNKKQYDYCYREENFKTKNELELEAKFKILSSMHDTFFEYIYDTYKMPPKLDVGIDRYAPKGIYRFVIMNNSGETYKSTDVEFTDFNQAKDFLNKKYGEFLTYHQQHFQPASNFKK